MSSNYTVGPTQGISYKFIRFELLDKLIPLIESVESSSFKRN